MIGASMLWVGWFGFNGGSALGAGQGLMAPLVTHLAASIGALSWMVIEWMWFGRRPSLVGIVTGMAKACHCDTGFGVYRCAGGRYPRPCWRGDLLSGG